MRERGTKFDLKVLRSSFLLKEDVPEDGVPHIQIGQFCQ